VSPDEHCSRELALTEASSNTVSVASQPLLLPSLTRQSSTGVPEVF